PGPWYVIRVDAPSNRIVVGRREELAVREIALEDVSFIDGTAPEPLACEARLRYHSPAIPAVYEGGRLALEGAFLGAARVLAEGLALFLCVRGLRWVAVPAVFAAAVLAPAGHAAGVIPAAGAEFADALHVLSAGMWAGGILALASLQPPGGWRGEEGRALLERFARMALIAFGVTALTGVLRATEQLTGLSDLWSTAYGLVLVFKAAGVLVMLALSALAWGRGL